MPEAEYALVGTVHDSILFEQRLKACAECKAPAYHWIEEGNYDDFKWNIIKSDLPVSIFGFSSSGFPLMGTYTGRLAVATGMALVANIQEQEPIERVTGMALMGTVAPVVFQPGDVVNYQGAHWVQADFATVEKTVIAMLLARPEMKHEPQAAAT